ncbi:MAG: glycosyltransferase family 2 protein [Clostridia bacterium]|nr:glycosyltransferase family 2 protein [Clostridia bacterium]
MELISVIIPTYKRSETLERAIKSIEDQTYPNIEIIVVDDNADFPEYREKNRQIVKKHEKVIFVENKNNLGGGLARNEGIKIAKGKFVAFLDDDDEYLPEKIEKQYNLYKKLKNDNIAMIYCYAKMINVDKSTYTRKVDFEGIPIIENVNNCIAATSWWFCPKEKLEAVGGFEDISSRQDASLLLKFLLNGYEIYRVPEILLNYYWHDGTNGISKVDWKAIEAEKKYRKIFMDNAGDLREEEKREIIYIFSSRLANMYIRLGDRKKAFEELLNMLKVHKISIKNIKIILGIVFNKLYVKIAIYKNKKRKR